MARLFYSVAGEGRGHATRASSVIEALRKNHTIVVYASNDAYAMLAPLYANSDIEVRQIPGFAFAYSDDDRLDYIGTGVQGLQVLSRFPQLLQDIEQAMRQECVDLVITDFEPLLPRAAKRCQVPFISLDHQHFLTTYDLSSLPVGLKLYATFLAQFVKGYYSGQAATIVSSFYFPDRIARDPNTHQIGVLLRPHVLAAKPVFGHYLVAYFRRSVTPNILQALSELNCEVRVYGLGVQPTRKNLHFRAIDSQRFIDDLAGSRGLISTAGNQLLGEALYLQKPLFVMPEPGNFEQHINGHFLARSGAGVSHDMEHVSCDAFKHYLDRAEQYMEHIDTERMCGNAQAIEVIEHFLAENDLHLAC